MRTLALTGILLFATLLVGCSDDDDSGDTERFFKDDIGITFEYPDSLREGDDITIDQSVGGSTVASYGLGLDNNDVILVQRVDLNGSFDESDMDLLAPEVDGLMAQLDPNAGPGKRVTVGGLPGFEYTARLASGETSRYTILIDGDRQYTINCQYVEKQQEILDACDVVLETLQKR